MSADEFRKVLVENRKARFEYEILEVYQAGISLMGSEVKAIRAGRANLQEAYARIEGAEVLLQNMHISPLPTVAQYFSHEPTRPRKLLLNRREIRKLIGKVEEKGLTLVPLKLYLEKSWIKVDIAVGRGKKLYDKREDIKNREIKREIARSTRGRYSDS
ncbi:SsrA-binding protein SmpB [Candidatus Cyanaurora vandensis]|uniref:SsrA-binding protein SmpB n=2 Tax=Candidatus Cyanaurora vandensis TaxID=2714958 RepID=UPI00257DB849|nr:SsrA-binding protein SmpB [Candidatus Cyanaurora vandensis]